MKEFFDDQPADLLISKIYQLTPRQRKNLDNFLDSLNEEKGQLECLSDIPVGLLHMNPQSRSDPRLPCGVRQPACVSE